MREVLQEHVQSFVAGAVTCVRLNRSSRVNGRHIRFAVPAIALLMSTRQLTHLTHRDTMRTFDVTPDGKQIVFDRLRDNSDIVMIERQIPGSH